MVGFLRLWLVLTETRRIPPPYYCFHLPTIFWSFPTGSGPFAFTWEETVTFYLKKILPHTTFCWNHSNISYVRERKVYLAFKRSNRLNFKILSNVVFIENNTLLFCRERFIRLQHENKMLKLRQTEENNNEQILILQANCEQLKDQNNQLTNDLW